MVKDKWLFFFTSPGSSPQKRRWQSQTLSVRMEDSEKWGRRGKDAVGKVWWFRALMSAIIAPPILEFPNFILMDSLPITERTLVTSYDKAHSCQTPITEGESEDSSEGKIRWKVDKPKESEELSKAKFIRTKLFWCGIFGSSIKASWHSGYSDGTYNRSIQPCIKRIIFSFFIRHCVWEMLTQQFEAVFYDGVEFYCIVLKRRQ